MRFREYDASSASSSQHAANQSCVEYHLSTICNDDDDEKSGQHLVWTVTSLDSTISKSHPNNNTNITTGGSIIKSIQTKCIHTTNKLKQLCKDLFLPIDYPHSVADGYLEYQLYDSLQGLCSYLRGVVSTSAVLSATGVGDAQATAMSAAMVSCIYDMHDINIYE